VAIQKTAGRGNSTRYLMSRWQAKEPAGAKIRREFRRNLMEEKRWPELVAGDKPA
jgi:hypothetical protein